MNQLIFLIGKFEYQLLIRLHTETVTQSGAFSLRTLVKILS